MQRTRFELSPGLWLDGRRAVWLEEPRALLVADLHLGYAWAHRQRGNLFPIGKPEDTLDRLFALVEEYAPREIVVLGDVIHAAVKSEAFDADLRRLCSLGERAALQLIAGNHDRHLADVLGRAGVTVKPVREYQLGTHLLIHGDGSGEAAAARSTAARERGGRVILGHEHPAITISDGVATSARCPCFLAAENLLVLPAFSPWAAGGNVRSGVYLSPDVQHSPPTHAIAIVAGKLLPMRM
jgi:DNA ligase-associated metallophosphoesterase